MLTLSAVSRSKQAAAAAHAVWVAATTATLQAAGAHEPEALKAVLGSARGKVESTAAAVQPSQPHMVHAAAAAAAISLAAAEAGRGRQWAAHAAAVRAGEAAHKARRKTEPSGRALAWRSVYAGSDTCK